MADTPIPKAEETKRLQDGYRAGVEVISKNTPPTSRIMVGIPMTGLLRSEWVLARYGQVIPCNWSQLDAIQWLDQTSPIDFMVADARNIVVQQFIEHGYDWLFFLDHDVVIPPDTVLRLNQRMLEATVPVWSGLYFTKSRPSEPLIYRGRGTGYYANWKFGDEVWVDGIPMGCTMIHRSILKVMWDESEQYSVVPGRVVRRVFETPAKVWWDPEKRYWWTMTGTEDLAWCTRIMNEGIFGKAGWPQYEGKEYPFMVDTEIFCRHIDFDGIQYPAALEQVQFIPDKEEDNERKKGTIFDPRFGVRPATVRSSPDSPGKV